MKNQSICILAAVCLLMSSCLGMPPKNLKSLGRLFSKTDNSRVINGHEAVDLGLKSGTLWAACNVGASTPEDKGKPYAWGEIESKPTDTPTAYGWDDYKFFKAPEEDMHYGTLTKYCLSPRNGDYDGKSVLEPEDDVAHVEWGDNWQIPSPEQFEELAEECSWKEECREGIGGYCVTGPNGQSIFLPMAEMYDAMVKGGVWPISEGTCYWLNSLRKGETLDSGQGTLMSLTLRPQVAFARRHKGVPIRPVWTPSSKND